RARAIAAASPPASTAPVTSPPVALWSSGRRRVTTTASGSDGSGCWAYSLVGGGGSAPPPAGAAGGGAGTAWRTPESAQRTYSPHCSQKSTSSGFSCPHFRPARAIYDPPVLLAAFTRNLYVTLTGLTCSIQREQAPGW